MILYQKLRDIKLAGERLVSNSQLAVALFRDIPELESFSFQKTSEYDDNNYFDSTRVTDINGHPYSYDGYEEEDEDECSSKLPKIENTDPIEDLVHRISDGYDVSEREITFKREEFQEDSEDKEKTYKTYLISYLSGGKLPMSFFSPKDPKWAVYYALDQGRLPEKTEFRVFAKRGNMHMALEYAKHVIKGRLPDNIENFYILDNHEDDQPDLARYLEFVKHGQKTTEEPVAVLPEVHQGSVVG